eukprot:CAMPEP_0206365754 /NCGR_PEP_ID=MMETSP0294-20121207/3054_1 /ASSEMBLY_ACC=CAM_ASM_000327 /TAXON_ID=39354 /ORGANISM="Heterosigma akashiwo, Strain CCMP2393" /LENGTH=430 /DNA_ID=CAMNT_0053811707 /DNA_START=424 /DNA_END=1713 /DNA_ORIENTATION=+
MSGDATVSNETTVLEGIVSQYLRHQHEQCADPISVLPPFSLLEPHSCPERKPILSLTNVVAQVTASRELHLPSSLFGYKKAARQFVYGRYRPWRCYRDLVGAGAVRLSAFLPHDPQRLLVGLDGGEVRLFNLATNQAEEGGVFECHAGDVLALRAHPDPTVRRFLSGDGEHSSLWDLTKPGGDPLVDYPGLSGAIFDNAGARVAGILDGEVAVYDANTGGSLGGGGGGRPDYRLTVHFLNWAPKYDLRLRLGSAADLDRLCPREGQLLDAGQRRRGEPLQGTKLEKARGLIRRKVRMLYENQNNDSSDKSSSDGAAGESTDEFHSEQSDSSHVQSEDSWASLALEYNVGDQVDVLDFYKSSTTGQLKQKWRPAEIITSKKSRVRIHYQGWPDKWDEDIPAKDWARRLRPAQGGQGRRSSGGGGDGGGGGG